MSYLHDSRSALYSFIFTLPLFFIYETGIIFLSNDDIVIIRNGADFLLRNILESFGIFGLYSLGVVFFIGFSVSYLIYFRSEDNKNIKAEYLFAMMVESIFWSAILYFLLSKFMLVLMNPIGKTIIQQVILAIGAGIYEEFLFRVVLISGLSFVIGFIFLWNDILVKVSALIVSAGIFSAFHFFGDYGDFFSIELFLIRFVAGIILGLLYYFRGFGITATSHSIYDLIVLIQLTTRF